MKNVKARRGAGAGSTLASVIYDQIRRDIMTGVLKPEGKLRIEALKELYGAGSTPIREALNRLVTEGLVIQHDQRGFQVPPVSVEDLDDLTRARSMLYDVTLREAIANGDMAWEEQIVLAFHRLTRTPEYLDDERTLNPRWGELHREFHRALISACNSRWLLEYVDRLFDLADRYRFLSMRSNAWTSQGVLEEHRAIMDAVIARDAERATRLMKEHIRHTPEEAHRQVAKDLTEKPAPAGRKRPRSNSGLPESVERAS